MDSCSPTEIWIFSVLQILNPSVKRLVKPLTEILIFFYIMLLLQVWPIYSKIDILGYRLASLMLCLLLPGFITHRNNRESWKLCLRLFLYCFGVCGVDGKATLT